MDNFNNLEEQTTKKSNEMFDMGMQFAFEGLTEEDFKANSEEELINFRRGYQAGLAMQPEASVPTEEFKGMGR